MDVELIISLVLVLLVLLVAGVSFALKAKYTWFHAAGMVFCFIGAALIAYGVLSHCDGIAIYYYCSRD